MTPRLWLLSCEELPSKNQGCGGQASSDSGATITSTPVVTKAIPLSLGLPAGKGVGCLHRGELRRSGSLVGQAWKAQDWEGMCLHQAPGNVDLKVLETLVARSVADTKRRYPQANEERRH